MSTTGAKKGGQKVGGRQKGTLNKTTAEMRAIIREVLDGELKNLPKLLKRMEPKDRADTIAKFLPYICPKAIEEPVSDKEGEAANIFELSCN